MTAKTAKKTAAQPAKKAAAKKTTTSKAAVAAKKLAAPPAAKKTAAKKSTAKKATRAGDVLTQHIAEAFAPLPKGTFLKVTEIAAVRTKSFPNDSVRPSSQTISGRCRDDRMPEGVKGQTGPRGAKKIS